MGRHRAATSDTRPHRRRRWPLAALTAVVLVVAGWFGWSWLHGQLSHSATPNVAACPAGPETVQVAVVPSMADVIGRAAAAYTESRPVVNDRCVRVNVSAVDPQAVLSALEHGWDAAKLGPRPQAWIADSTLRTNELASAAAGVIGDTPQSLAASPVVLAMPPDAAKAVTSAGAPMFAALPALVAKANGWATFNEPAWGQFTLALPSPAANTASALAAIAMLDPATPQGQAPVTADLLNSPPVKQNLVNLALGQPASTANTTHDTLLALGRADGIHAAPFSAVPVTELDLYQRNVGADGSAKPVNVLDEVRLGGPTPYVDFPFTPLAGNGVHADQVAAAEHFRDFLRTPAEQAQFARSGLRVASSFAHPAPSPGMDWGSASQGPTPVDVGSYQQLVTAWQAAGQPSR
ncbi:MAG TPA: substrate-binding domain-containing protein [Pseudonocardiaceae bacterium]|nr:substrate-binding domain-containing protein [Pseudonocardiaceae bacterium]